MRVQRNERLGFVEPTKKIKRSGKTQEMTIARRGVVVTRGADLKPQKLQRVCHGRFFPEGKVSFIAGEPGLGKSQIAACMAAIVSAGADWPLHGGPRRHGDVIYISAEDGGADAIRSRLEAAGAHLPRVQIIEAINDELGRRPFNLVVDLDKLDEILRAFPIRGWSSSIRLTRAWARSTFVASTRTSSRSCGRSSIVSKRLPPSTV
jgi:predicted ATP-dependent serine protease